MQQPQLQVHTADHRTKVLNGMPISDDALQSLRMVTACFLTEYLNIHWAEGAAWYHDTLVRRRCIV